MALNQFHLPYYAVIFTSKLSDRTEGYDKMAHIIENLAQKQEGFLGIDTARQDIGITVSYWKSLEAIKRWKAHSDHKIAQELGQKQFYKSYSVRICKVEHHYEFSKD